jgi:hypothetical protein
MHANVHHQLLTITLGQLLVLLFLQELIELAERKFLREVMSYADSMETSPFPRLFVLDFLTEAEKHELNPAAPAEDKPNCDGDHSNKETCPGENNPNTTASCRESVSQVCIVRDLDCCFIRLPSPSVVF